MGLLDIFKKNKPESETTSTSNTTQANPTNYYVQDLVSSTFDGGKFPGSFGITKDYSFIDYWTLRMRSVQLFKENNYARGAIRRLLRNEIYTGLNLEANPIGEILGMSEEQMIKWAEDSELNYNLWANDPKQVDYHGQKTLGELAHDARQTALISGDALIVLRANKKTSLPMIQLIDGSNVNATMNVKVRKGNYILNGIEYNAKGDVVAYWVQTQTTETKGVFGDNASPVIKQKRIPASGEKSGRRMAWMIYGTDKLLHENRGEPILSSVMYMIKELDRYKDAEIRAATVNAIIPLFIKKNVPGPGSNPMGTGAVRRGTATTTDLDGSQRNFHITNNLPGMVLDQLAVGEEIVSHDTKRPNVNYKLFEEAIINAFAWCLEIPPEIMRLLFQSNFSASRQANNELNIYLQYRFWKFGKEFYQPVYEEHLFSSVLTGVFNANGLIEAKRKNDYKTVNAWTHAEWSGLSRPSVDVNKDASAAEKTLGLRIATYDYWSRRFTGMSFRNTLQKLARENKLLERAGITSTIDEDSQGVPLEDSSFTKEENENENQDKNNNEKNLKNLDIKILNQNKNIINMLQEVRNDIEEIREDK